MPPELTERDRDLNTLWALLNVCAQLSNNPDKVWAYFKSYAVEHGCPLPSGDVEAVAWELGMERAFAAASMKGEEAR